MRAQEGNDKVVIQPATITAGEEFYLPIEVEWVDGLSYKAFQMEIVLPEGISPVYETYYDDDEEKDVSVLVFKRGKLSDSHSLSDNYRADENVLGLVCVSTAGNNLKKSVAGPLVSVKLKAAADMPGGTYEFKLTNVKFTDSKNTGHVYADATATFTIPSYHTYKFMNEEDSLYSGLAVTGAMISEPDTVLTRTGYTFKGWNPAFTGIMPDADVIYKADWKPNKYKMTFVLDDSEIIEDSLTYGEAFEAPKNLTKTGYTFSDVWVPALPETVPAEEMTFIAQWEINQYTMTFVLDNGEANVVKIQDYNSVLTAPNPTKTGYEFKGWDHALPETVPAKDSTFTAQWEINQYTMTFVLDNGEANVVKIQDYNSVLTAPNPTKTGFIFVGWDSEVPATIPAKDSTFTAQWERATFKLTFDIDGQKIDSLMPYEAPIVVPADTVKEGYTFKGWDADVPETMPAEALTFTAQFEINKYWVTFMAEGTEVSKTQMEYNADIVAPTAPELDGKRFLDWDPKVDAKVPAHDVTYDAIYALVVYDTVYVVKTIPVSDLQRVEAPFINVNADKKIELTCVQKDAVIYYTIDGTEPTEASLLYSEPFEVVDKTVIKAIAVLRSEVSQFQLQVGMKNVRVTGDGGKTYNLQGRQISKASRGVFIQDGKKVIMK
jgi:hypothetical protein